MAASEDDSTVDERTCPTCRATARDEVASKVRFLRESLDLSQAEFADVLNVATKTVVNWENGLVTRIPYGKVWKVSGVDLRNPFPPD